MKAINVDQPWAELIIQGRKTIELRKTNSQHRGVLAIRATLTAHPALCEHFGLDPDTLVKGAVLGTVQLVAAQALTSEKWQTWRDCHLSPAPFPGKWKWGWLLETPRRLATPLICGALPGMFTLPEEISKQIIEAEYV